MSNFYVKVYEAEIEVHPNADAIEICKIGEYCSIVKKGEFKNGDLVAYIPEASIVPKNTLEELGLVDKLSGPGGNRVKAVKLRGIVSQGLVYRAKPNWALGDDVTEELGIVKYEPSIADMPVELRGNYMNAGQHRTLKYDVENFKKFPNLIAEGEQVVFTEKLHGTCCIIGVMPNDPDWLEGLEECGSRLTVSSKGLGQQGFSYRHKHPDNQGNVYCKVANQIESQLVAAVDQYVVLLDQDPVTKKCPVFILGEVFGSGVQDLTYGCKPGEVLFRAFDVYVGNRDNGFFLGDEELESFLRAANIDRVPVAYRGPFSKTVLEEHTNGKETVSGKGACIREGVVVRPVIERVVSFRNNPYKFDGIFGRVQLKSVSNDYLFRKGNVTEFN